MGPIRNKLLAILYGLVCHGIFLMAGAVMFITILTGFQFSAGSLEGLSAVAINFLLLIQFPLGHSFFLSNRGMKALEIFAPKSYAKTLRTTVYATIASIQLILLFSLWNFSGVFIWQIESPANIVMIILNLLSWALLSISSIQAGYKVQTGSLGWTSVYLGKKPVFPDMPHSWSFFNNKATYLSLFQSSTLDKSGDEFRLIYRSVILQYLLLFRPHVEREKISKNLR